MMVSYAQYQQITNKNGIFLSTYFIYFDIIQITYRFCSAMLCAIGFGTHRADHILLLPSKCIFDTVGCCQFMFFSLLCANDADKIVYSTENCYISKNKTKQNKKTMCTTYNMYVYIIYLSLVKQNETLSSAKWKQMRVRHIYFVLWHFTRV